MSSKNEEAADSVRFIMRTPELVIIKIVAFIQEKST